MKSSMAAIKEYLRAATTMARETKKSCHRIWKAAKVRRHMKATVSIFWGSGSKRSSRPICTGPISCKSPSFPEKNEFQNKSGFPFFSILDGFFCLILKLDQNPPFVVSVLVIVLPCSFSEVPPLFSATSLRRPCFLLLVLSLLSELDGEEIWNTELLVWMDRTTR